MESRKVADLAEFYGFANFRKKRLLDREVATTDGEPSWGLTDDDRVWRVAARRRTMASTRFNDAWTVTQKVENAFPAISNFFYALARLRSSARRTLLCLPRNGPARRGDMTIDAFPKLGHLRC